MWKIVLAMLLCLCSVAGAEEKSKEGPPIEMVFDCSGVYGVGKLYIKYEGRIFVYTIKCLDGKEVKNGSPRTSSS